MNLIGKNIDHAAALLKAGGLVAIPTETVYGLAAHALQADAILKIFAAKNRPHFNPLIAHTNSWEKAQQFIGSYPPLAQQLAEAFWPGPLTLLLPRASHLPDLLTAGSPLVAIRIPSHPLTLALLEKLDFPLAAPSANPSGYISPTTPAHVADQLGDKVAYILDGGPTEIGIESTIIGFNEKGEAVLYRLGGLSLEEIEAISGPLHMLPQVQNQPDSPGQLKSHYAPRTPLVMDEAIPPKQMITQVGALRFQQPISTIPISQQIVLSPKGDLGEAAKKLFAALRELDVRGYDLILAERFPDMGLGRAINDRLERAQHKFKED